MGRPVARAGLAFVALAIAACGSGREDGGADGNVTVLAAASLTDAFADIVDAFEADHPGLDVVVHLAGSSSLREQVLAGAPADVIAVADPSALDGLDLAGEPVAFATNRLVLAVPEGNPGEVAGLADLARRDLLIGLCAPAVPCGALARAALDRLGIAPAVDTEEPDVRGLLTKLTAGELDAGLVYATDARAPGAEVAIVDTGGGLADAVATYPIAVLADAPNRDAAEAFVAFVDGPAGAAILDRHGFGS